MVVDLILSGLLVVWFIDRAHFPLDGLVNRHNSRFWGTENAHLCQTWPLYSLKCAVWAALSRKSNIGPFSQQQTTTTVWYTVVLEEFVITLPSDTSWIHQTLCDSGKMVPDRIPTVLIFLEEYFCNRVMIWIIQKLQGQAWIGLHTESIVKRTEITLPWAANLSA